VVYIHASPTADGLHYDLTFEDVVDPNGDYHFEPHFLAVMCWESEKEGVEQPYAEEEAQPLRLPSHEVCLCSVCKGSITNEEIVGVMHLGEVSVSERMPDEDAIEFVQPEQAPVILCADCLWILNDSVTTYWGDKAHLRLLSEATDTRAQWSEATG